MSNWQTDRNGQPFQTTDTKAPAFPQPVTLPNGGTGDYGGGVVTPRK